MKIFSDVPDWYLSRLSKMYSKGFSYIKKCPRLFTLNHLIQPCSLCKHGVSQSWDKPKMLRLDRRYALHYDTWELLCLKAFIRQRRIVYTSLEFPTPKIVQRGHTRIPLLYEPLTDTIFDCFKDEKEASECGKYFIGHAQRVCAREGLFYNQVIVDKDLSIRTISRQPRDFDEDLLLVKLYQTMQLSNGKL